MHINVNLWSTGPKKQQKSYNGTRSVVLKESQVIEVRNILEIIILCDAKIRKFLRSFVIVQQSFKEKHQL